MSDIECSGLSSDVIKSFVCTFQKANNNGADQTARVCRLVFAFVVCMQQSVFPSEEACACITGWHSCCNMAIKL